jgi:protein tyrosine/serine phosphatase
MKTRNMMINVGCVAFLLVSHAPAEPAAPLNAAAAQTPAPSTNGLPNFFKFSEILYRGAQPAPGGFRELKAMGIRTVVNLRAFHSDRVEVAPTGMQYEEIPMKTWHAEQEDIVRFLRIVQDPNRTPVFVHCQHGADRTGLMCAMYRIVVCGWDKQKAIKEMTGGGFGFHPVWTNIVKFIEDIDVDGLRRAVDAPPKAPARGNL